MNQKIFLFVLLAAFAICFRPASVAAQTCSGSGSDTKHTFSCDYNTFPPSCKDSTSGVGGSCSYYAGICGRCGWVDQSSCTETGSGCTITNVGYNSCGMTGGCYWAGPAPTPTNTPIPGYTPPPSSGGSCNGACQSYAGQSQCLAFGNGHQCSWNSGNGCCSCDPPCNPTNSTPPPSPDYVITTAFYADTNLFERGYFSGEWFNAGQPLRGFTRFNGSSARCTEVRDDNNGSWKGYYSCGPSYGSVDIWGSLDDVDWNGNWGGGYQNPQDFFCTMSCAGNSCPNIPGDAINYAQNAYCEVKFFNSGYAWMKFSLIKRKQVGGRVVNRAGQGIPGVVVRVDDSSQSPPLSYTATTDSAGNWSGYFVRGPWSGPGSFNGDIYTVSVSSAPSTYQLPAKTSSQFYTWNNCSLPPGDQPLGSSIYQCQKYGYNDCSGSDGTSALRCNFVLDPSERCTVTSIVPSTSSIYIGGRATAYTATVLPERGSLTGITGTISNAVPSGVTGTLTAPTLSPALPTTSTVTAGLTLTIPRTSAAGALQLNITGTMSNGSTCTGSALVTVVNPQTTFFTARGGDITIPAANLGTNFPYLNPPPYFIDPDSLSGKPGMAFGVRGGAGWYGTLPLTEQLANINHWLIDTNSSGWNNLLAKTENTYSAMKIKLLNKVGSATEATNTESWQTAVSRAATNTSGKIGDVNIIHVSGGNWSIGSSTDPVNVDAAKVIFLVDGDVNINGEIHRNKAMGGFIAIFSNGNIVVNSAIGSTAPDITLLPVGQLEGIFFAQNTFISAHQADSTRKLRIDGSVIGMQSINLSNRDVTDVTPAHYFNFQPDLIATLNTVGLRQKLFSELQAP